LSTVFIGELTMVLNMPLVNAVAATYSLQTSDVQKSLTGNRISLMKHSCFSKLFMWLLQQKSSLNEVDIIIVKNTVKN